MVLGSEEARHRDQLAMMVPHLLVEARALLQRDAEGSGGTGGGGGGVLALTDWCFVSQAAQIAGIPALYDSLQELLLPAGQPGDTGTLLAVADILCLLLSRPSFTGLEAVLQVHMLLGSLSALGQVSVAAAPLPRCLSGSAWPGLASVPAGWVHILSSLHGVLPSAPLHAR
jgi:hypothetical protein